MFSDTAVAVVQKEQDRMLMEERAICLVWISVGFGWGDFSGRGRSLLERNVHSEILLLSVVTFKL